MQNFTFPINRYFKRILISSTLLFTQVAQSDVPTEVQNVFINNGCLNCHSGAAPSGGLSLDDAAISETSLLDVASTIGGCDLQRVDSGNPENSTLYDKIANQTPQCGGIMPPGGPQPNSEDVETIYNWIVSLGPAGQFGLIEFDSATYSAQETDPNVTVTVNRNLGTQGEVSINYSVLSVAGDTATAGEDYVADANTLTFGNGQTSQTIVINLIDDEVFEGAEEFSVVLDTPTGGAELGTRVTSKVTIIENEIDNQPGRFFFDAVFYEINEGDGSLDFEIIRANGEMGQVTVNLNTEPGTATENTDYQMFNQTITFEEGESRALVSINIIDDQSMENTEVFSLRLSAPTNGAELGTPSTVEVSIFDNDSDDSDGDDQTGDDNTEFEVPEEEEFSAAGVVDWIGILFLILILKGKKREFYLLTLINNDKVSG